MATPEKPTDMPFIFTDNNGKAEPAKRKLIRKYVMLGKNRGKIRKVKPIKMETQGNFVGSNNDWDGAPGLLMKMRYSMIPNKVGSELSFTQFAAAVEPPLIHDLLKFSFIAKRVMYPLERYIVFHRKTKIDTSWFELLTSDAAYMHAAVFTTQAYISHTSAREAPVAARRAIAHHSSALRLLRERLSVPKGEDNVSDSTVLVVLYLALHAHFMLDYSTAKHHVEGLRKIVDMGGGLIAFNHNTKLIIELLKCDLGIALNNDTRPMFFDEQSSESLMSYDMELLAAEKLEPPATKPYWKLIQLGIDANLVQALSLLKSFCSTMNSAIEHKRLLPKETLLKPMASVMYPLLRMKSFDLTSIDEAVRLGLLVFSSNIFLNWQGLKPPHTYLPHTYRSYLLNPELASTLPPPFYLWLLMIGSLSIFTPAEDAWLTPLVRVHIELCKAHNWSELRGQLKAFPWIDLLHDEPGRAIFDAAVLLQSDIGTAPLA